MPILFLQQDDAKTRVLDIAFFAEPSGAVNNETHECTAEATEAPVETGINITDHVQPGNITLSCEATVTMTPHAVDQLRQKGVVAPVVITAETPYDPLRRGPPPGTPGFVSRGALAAISGRTKPVIANANVLQFLQPYTPITGTWNKLLGFLKDAALLKILTPRADYEDMVLLVINMTVGQGSSARFQVVARQIKTVSTILVPAPQPLELRGQPKLSKGNQSSGPATGTNSESGRERLRSKLRQSLDAIAPGWLPSVYD